MNQNDYDYWLFCQHEPELKIRTASVPIKTKEITYERNAQMDADYERYKLITEEEHYAAELEYLKKIGAL